MPTTISRVEAARTPCGRTQPGERHVTEDQEGLVTEEVAFACGCRTCREEFHDGSVHFMAVGHQGKVLVDEELRGE